MKVKNICICLLTLVFVVGIIIGAVFFRRAPGNFEGVLNDISSNQEVLTLGVAGGQQNFFINSKTSIYNESGYAVSSDYLQQGFTVKVIGSNNGIAKKIYVTNAPNITISSPLSGGIVGEVFTVEGVARVFENQFLVRVKDKVSGAIYFQGSVYSNAQDAGLYGHYSAQINLSDSNIQNGEELIIEAYDLSAMDGSEIDNVGVVVTYSKSAITASFTTLKVFFAKTSSDPNLECTTVYPLTRNVESTVAVGRAAIEELLKGVTQNEKTDGYFSAIPDGVVLQSIIIKDGVAHVDFNSTLNKVGGSCRVAEIREQITKTLKQFSTVQSVVISVDGDADTALQP